MLVLNATIYTIIGAVIVRRTFEQRRRQTQRQSSQSVVVEEALVRAEMLDVTPMDTITEVTSLRTERRALCTRRLQYNGDIVKPAASGSPARRRRSCFMTRAEVKLAACGLCIVCIQVEPSHSCTRYR